MTAHPALASQVLLTPGRNGLLAAQDTTVDVLVRVQAPDAEPGDAPARPAQAVALVIDRSGSMNGRPLQQAQRCAEFVVASMRPSDSVSLVEFDHRVRRLWPAIPVGDGEALRAAIRALASGGNTDLHAGWLEGARTLADVPGNGLKRVILLSDGCANAGLTDGDQIEAQCKALAADGCTTSTYGLGRRFNEDLMVAMARAGGGNHYYGDTAEDLMEPFQQELDLLANLALRQVELRLAVPEGVTVEVLNDLAPTDSGWRLPDLAWGSEAWALLRLDVRGAAVREPGRTLTALRASVSGQTLSGAAVRLDEAVLTLPSLPAAAFDALVPDELVLRRASEVAASKVLDRMRAAAQDGHWDQVDRMLADARERFAGNPWVAAMVAGMAAVARSRSRERMRKEALYASMSLKVRLTAKEEAAYLMDDMHEAAYLKRKPLQGKAAR